MINKPEFLHHLEFSFYQSLAIVLCFLYSLYSTFIFLYFSMQACQNQNNLRQSIFEYPQRAEFLQNNWYEMISILILVLGWNSELSMNSGHLLVGGEFLCKMQYLIWKYTYTKFNQPLKIKRQNSFIYLFLHSLNCTCYKIPSITKQIKYQAKIKYPTFKRRTITLKKTQANQ